MSIADAIDCVMARREVPAPVLEEAFGTIMDGKATPAQIGALLVGLRTKGETVAEMVAVARAMRARAQTAPLADPAAVDTCGTGGDGSGTFNISTTAAFVAAGAGLTVAKHGNRAASSRTGSADVLEALGVRIDLAVADAAEVLGEVGIGFFFARRAHPAMRHVAPVRAELGVRTLMNCMGPLLNPVGARRQVVGVYAADLVEPLAHVLSELGADAAWVVHGDDGLDEITTTGRTRAAKLEEGAIVPFVVDPESLGIPLASREALAGGDAQENAAIARSVLAGEGGAPADIVALNAAAALVVGGRADDLAGGLALARAAIASGAAADKLDALVAATQRRAGG